MSRISISMLRNFTKVNIQNNIARANQPFLLGVSSETYFKCYGEKGMLKTINSTPLLKKRLFMRMNKLKKTHTDQYTNINETKYSRVYQVKFVEDSL